jgi:hypothetical protein
VLLYLLLCYSCLHGSNYSQIAQLAELRTVNPLVVGSSPTLGAMDKQYYLSKEDIMKQTYHLLGKRLELISCADEYTHLSTGDQGIVNYIDDTGTVFVSWDNGSKLGLIPGVDKWKIIYA